MSRLLLSVGASPHRIAELESVKFAFVSPPYCQVLLSDFVSKQIPRLVIKFKYASCLHSLCLPEHPDGLLYIIPATDTRRPLRY
mmetsp:Transcript_19371/g.32728  ORF Transcript_19371/g.32728 Transcript_19371/m.32728 type:complete len:84 (-) Transcript_19371:589-840(-)